MRLWHYSLIPILPRQQLVAQWRECCAIARNWAKNGTPNHILVNKVMNYHSDHFRQYVEILLQEFDNRGYRTTSTARDNFYSNLKIIEANQAKQDLKEYDRLFDDWHNDIYLRECLYNLEEKAMCGGLSKEEWRIIYNRYNKYFDLWTCFSLN